MFESIPNSRPFKPLASIACRNDTVNLRCQVVIYILENRLYSDFSMSKHLCFHCEGKFGNSKIDGEKKRS